MSKRSEKLLLEDILEGLENIETYSKDHATIAEFLADQKTKDAVVRNFEIIGEAANRLSKEFLIRYPLVDWSGLIGFRNVLIHQYFGVDYGVVWHIIQNELLAIREHISFIINDLD